MADTDYILLGKDERIYSEFRTAAGVLADPTAPFVTIYDPNGAIFDTGTPTKESTGVYYYNVSLSTASTTEEGYYQAFWEGTIDGALVTMDVPQYFRALRVPPELTQPDHIVMRVRRAIGDTNPDTYRISTQDLQYFLESAVESVQAEYDFGYTLTKNGDGTITWNKSLYSNPASLFVLKCVIDVMEATMHDYLFQGGSVNVGDIKVDVNGMLRIRSEHLKYLRDQYKRLMYEIKMNGIGGIDVDTHVTGLINNTSNREYIFYQFGM